MTQLVLVEIVLEFAPINSVQISHLSGAELFVEGHDVAWKCRTQRFIIGTQAIPLLSGVVCPLLKLREGGDGNDAGKTVHLSLKLCPHIHRRFVVSGDTVALNRLKEGSTNAIRMFVVVLQSLVVILAGLDVVTDIPGQ